jgi:hypothetical protein
VRRLALLAVAVGALAAAPSAAAAGWYPHASDATWTYVWSDSAYNPTPTTEKVTVKEQAGASFTLEWTTEGQDNPPEAPVSVGTVSFQESPAGLVNTDWSSNPPPPAFPILCARPASCGNSLASALYNLIWGSRAPTLAEPLLAGTTWLGTGGAGNDVASDNAYAGTEDLKVAAFEQPVRAAKIRSEITQAGALGDPYGSGIRTVWWVYGVGPVKLVFEHTGGPVTTVELTSTNQVAAFPPSDVNSFPLRRGLKGRLRWTNRKHLPKPVVVDYEIDQVSNASARFVVKSVSGPIRLAAEYGFTLRTTGVTNIWGVAQAQTRVKFPPLGPRALPAAKRRRFLTPFDLLTFGFNPLLPAYPAGGDTWSAATSGRDYAVYGVTGTARVVGTQTVRVPAGRFSALVIRTTLRQPGFPFGSGTRTTWLAPGRGLVRLEFRHGDGSVSLVELLR